MSDRKVVKKVKNGVLYSDGTMKIENVRASYPHLDRAWSKNESDRKKFSITGLGSKETHKAVKDLAVEVINAMLLENKMGKIGAEHKFFRDGDNSGKDEAEGCWLIKASENADKQPIVRDRKADKITDPDEISKLVYPGCFVNIFIRPWPQNNAHGKKINANLIAVQFVGDGERFGEGNVDDDDVFEQYESDDDGGFDENGADDDEL